MLCYAGGVGKSFHGSDDSRVLYFLTFAFYVGGVSQYAAVWDLFATVEKRWQFDVVKKIHGIEMAGDVIKIPESEAWNDLELNELHEET